MIKTDIFLHRGLFVLAALVALDTLGLDAAKDPLIRLQDSFGVAPAGRKKIYAEIIRDSSSANTDPETMLARAVAFQQRAMDLEDEYISRMIETAPDFAPLEKSAPPFLRDYQHAAAEFEALAAQFPFSESYGKSARLVARFWNDCNSLYQAALSFGRNYP